MRKRRINLYCNKCGYKTNRLMEPFAEGEDLRCPECRKPMIRRIRIDCMTEGCKRWSIVEGDPTFNNYNFYNKEHKRTIDIRNKGFICSDHVATLRRPDND